MESTETNRYANPIHRVVIKVIGVHTKEDFFKLREDISAMCKWHELKFGRFYSTLNDRCHKTYRDDYGDIPTIIDYTGYAQFILYNTNWNGEMQMDLHEILNDMGYGWWSINISRPDEGVIHNTWRLPNERN